MKSQVEYVQATTEDIEQLINLRLAYINEDFGIIDKKQAIKIKNQLQIYFEKHIGKDCVIFTAKENGNIIATAIPVIIEKPANPRFLYSSAKKTYRHSDYINKNGNRVCK